MPRHLRYKVHKCGLDKTLLSPTDKEYLAAVAAKAHLLRSAAHELARYVTMRACAEDVLDNMPSVFAKGKKNGWTAFYSAVATGKAPDGSHALFGQWVDEYIAFTGIAALDLVGLGNLVNSHLAQQSAVLSARHIKGQYERHVRHFVRVHFRAMIMSEPDRDKRRAMWRQVDTACACLLDACPDTLSTMGGDFGAVLGEFLRLHLESGRFKRYLSDKDRTELVANGDIEAIKCGESDMKAWLCTMWYMGVCVQALSRADLKVRVRRLLPLVDGHQPKQVTFGSITLINALHQSRRYWENSSEGLRGIWQAVFTPEALRGPASFHAPQAPGAKRYLFAHEARTDGKAQLSLVFVHEDDYATHVGAGQAKANGKKRKAEDPDAWEADKTRKTIDGAKAKVERQNKNAAQRQQIKDQGQRPSVAGIPYFDTLNPQEVRAKNKVYVDSGSSGHDMITDGFSVKEKRASQRATWFVAEQRRRRHMLGTVQRKRLQDGRMRESGVLGSTEFEQLEQTSSNDMTPEGFLSYCMARSAYTLRVLPVYIDPWWSVQKLQAYGARKSYEAWLVKTLRHRFGPPESTMFIVGDYSAHYRPSLRGTMPAFVVGFARLLKAAGYSVAWIDEYNTSKLYHATHEPGDQMRVPVRRPLDDSEYGHQRSGRGKGDEKGRRVRRVLEDYPPKPKDTSGTRMVTRELHAVKQFTTAQGLKACINRDTNACLNFRYIVYYWLEHGRRPEAFCRASQD